MGEFPSGQRGQTVNLLLIASVVRIHLPPPNIRNPNFFPVGNGSDFLFISGIFQIEFCASSAGLMPGCWHLFYFQFIEFLCGAVRKLYYNLSEH